MDEKVLREYSGDYEQNFIADTYREIKRGQTGFAYKKEVLSQIIERLDKDNFKYRISDEKDYYKIVPLEREYRDGKKKKKQTY